MSNFENLIFFFFFVLGAARSKATANNVWWLISVGMAELVGTGMLVFMGCTGGVVFNPEHPPSHLQQCLCFGITVAIIIQVSLAEKKLIISLKKSRPINNRSIYFSRFTRFLYNNRAGLPVWFGQLF